MTTIADNALEILPLSRDGEDLDPKHLKLVECAVNGRRNQKGLRRVRELLAQLRHGYRTPWFHGVQHMTRNHAGYVLSKGRAIEHFSGDCANSDEAKTYVEELARRCTILETKEITADTADVVWRWNDGQ